MKQCKIILQQHKHLCILSFSALAFYAFSAVSMQSQAEVFSQQEQLPSQYTEYTIAGKETRNGKREIKEKGHEVQNGYRETKLEGKETQNGYSSIKEPSELA